MKFDKNFDKDKICVHSHENFNKNAHSHEKSAHIHGDHDHNGSCPHSHTSNKKVLKNSFLIIFVFMIIEAIAAFMTNSLALLSDAGHMLSDALALFLSLFAFKFGEKKANLKNSFGYKRMEILIAALNALTLLIIALYTIFEAISRFINPPKVASEQMLIIAILGLIVNIFVAIYMLKNADTKSNVNMRGAYLHVLSDLLGSLGAIIAALLMIYFDFRLADPIVSVFIAVLIAKSGLNLLKTSLHILMEGAPAQIKSDDVISLINSVSGVKNIHHLHIWSITSKAHALSAHIVIDGDLSLSQGQIIIKDIEKKLINLGINHTTLQLETTAHGHDEGLVCELVK